MAASLIRFSKLNAYCIVGILSLLILANTVGATEWTLVKQEACFSATSLLTTYTFNPPRSGNVDAVKLVHTSGEVTCNTATGYTNWGCVVPGWQTAFLVYLVQHNIDESLDLVLPTWNTQDVTVFYLLTEADQERCADTCYQWGYIMNGDGVSESDLIWSDSALNLYVDTSDIFSVQYSEGCCGASSDDNDGIACADVYFQYEPTPSPTPSPTQSPTTSYPTTDPTSDPTSSPTDDPSSNPMTESPTRNPTMELSHHFT